MKKILSMLGVFSIIASSSTTMFINKKQDVLEPLNDISILNDSDIAWNEINESVNDHFENQIKKESMTLTKSLNDENESAISNNEIELKAEEASKDYLEKFKDNNWKFDEMISYIKEVSPEFKEEFDEQLNKNNDSIEKNIDKLKTEQISMMQSTNNQYDINRSAQKIEDLSYELNKSSTLSLASAVSASVVAAGYWAVSWWFGISIPAAKSATVVAALSAATAIATYSIKCYFDHEKDKALHYKDIKDAHNFVKTIKNVVTIIRTINAVEIVIMSANAPIITVNSWAFIPGFFYATYLLKTVQSFFATASILEMFLSKNTNFYY